MKIYCYFSVHERLLAAVGVILREQYGADAFGGFVWGRDQADHVRATGAVNWRLDVFSDWLRDLPASVDLDILKTMERRYGLPNVATMAYADRHLAGSERIRILRIAALCFAEFEGLIAGDRPDVLLYESSDSLPTLILHSIATRNGIPTVMLDPERIIGRVAVYDNHLQRWPHLDRAYAERRERGLGADERIAAEAFIADFRSRTERPVHYARHTDALDRTRGKRFLTGARRFARDPLNVTLASPTRAAAQRVARVLRSRSTGWLRTFDAPRERERYVLFPLHFQPEANTLVSAPFYVDQPALIADLARCLPVDHLLYVKEHFASTGRRPLDDYRRIKRLWNVRLIGPEANAHELIRRSSGVVTIASTMGWEAMLLDRPVMTFGEVFYNGYDGVIRADQAPKSDWPALMTRLVSERRPDRDRLVTFVAAVLETTYPGSLVLAPPDSRPDVMAPENVRELAAAFARAIGLSAVRPAHRSSDGGSTDG